MALDDFCIYDESNDFFTTCIKQEHLDAGHECALLSDFELGLRLADLERTLALVLRQTKARLDRMPPTEPRVRMRLLRQSLTSAKDEVQLAGKTLHNQGGRQ